VLGLRPQLTIVGWYHSHPVFRTEPSVRDIENQEIFQGLFQCEDTKLYPYVGFIFGSTGRHAGVLAPHSRLTPRGCSGPRIELAGPYDVRLPDAASSVRCFTVRAARHPMKMDYAVLHADPDAGLSERLVRRDVGVASFAAG